MIRSFIITIYYFMRYVWRNWWCLKTRMNHSIVINTFKFWILFFILKYIILKFIEMNNLVNYFTNFKSLFLWISHELYKYIYIYISILIFCLKNKLNFYFLISSTWQFKFLLSAIFLNSEQFESYWNYRGYLHHVLNYKNIYVHGMEPRYSKIYSFRIKLIATYDTSKVATIYWHI